MAFAGLAMSALYFVADFRHPVHYIVLGGVMHCIGFDKQESFKECSLWASTALYAFPG